MRKFLFFSVLFLCCVLQAAKLSLSLDRAKIYQGESVIANVVLDGSRENANVPVFGNAQDDEIEYLGSRDSSQRSIMIVNGKMTDNSVERRVFVFRITPSTAGTFATGDVTLKTKDGVIRAPGKTIAVTGVEKRDDIIATVSCDDTTVMVDGQFTVNLTVSLRALDPPYGEVEPILQGQPLHIDADFLNMTEVKGLNLPDLEKILNGLISRRSNTEPSFSINSYVSRGMSMSFFDIGGDPFAERPIQFRLPPKRVKRDGVDYFDYSISLDYTPTAEGDYTFGPVTVKGEIIKGANADRTAQLEEVFVVGPAVTVRVVPPPEEGRPDTFIGSVGKSLKAKASLDTSRCKVGDPLTLTLDLTGKFSLSNLRPPLLSFQPSFSEDFRVYDDNIESENIEDGKRFKYRVRPLKAGTLEFPPVYVAYYDTVSNAYVTVATDPMPLQVEETTRIAATSSGEGEEETGDSAALSATAKVPDGIMSSFADPEPRCLAYGSGKCLLVILLAPVAWLLVVALKALVAVAVRRYRESGLGRRASASLRSFRKARALAGTDPVAAASSASAAARVAVAAKLGLETVSMTVPEMRRELSARGIDEKTVADICSSFEELERLSYSHGEATADGVKAIIDMLGEALQKAGTALKVIIGILLLAVSVPETSSALGTDPAAFEWERANQAMATSFEESDFLEAARLYYSMVTNGASRGPLYYNLSTALLLAGQPVAAQEALSIAERHLGTCDEIANNMKLASASGQIPVSRIFLCWHYGLPFAMRLDLAVACWLVFWAVLVLLTLAGKSKRLRFLRSFLRLLAALAMLAVIVFGASAALSYLQERNGELPRVGAALVPQTLEQGEAK